MEKAEDAIEWNGVSGKATIDSTASGLVGLGLVFSAEAFKGLNLQTGSIKMSLQNGSGNARVSDNGIALENVRAQRASVNAPYYDIGIEKFFAQSAFLDFTGSFRADNATGNFAVTVAREGLSQQQAQIDSSSTVTVTSDGVLDYDPNSVPEDVGWFVDVSGGLGKASYSMNVVAETYGKSSNAGQTSAITTGIGQARVGYYFSITDRFTLRPNISYVAIGGGTTTENADYEEYDSGGSAMTYTATTTQVANLTSVGLAGVKLEYGVADRVRVGISGGLGIIGVSGTTQTTFNTPTPGNYEEVDYSATGLAYEAGFNAGYVFPKGISFNAGLDYIGGKPNASTTTGTPTAGVTTYGSVYNSYNGVLGLQYNF